MFDFKSQAVPAIRALKAYDPGHDIPALRMQFADGAGLLELGSNENCYGQSAQVQAALAAQMPLLNRYPDPSGKALKAAIAVRHGVDSDQILLGNGSHELLMQLAQVFAGAGDEVLVSRYCFAVYPIATQAAGADLIMVEPFAAGSGMPLGHDLDAMAAAVTARTKLVFFANPNNPTGTWFSLKALEAFMAKLPERVLVVADEAYIEYANAPEIDSALALRRRFPNLIIARTFSKAYGLAGLRAGYLIADASVVQAMEPVRESFNLNAFALAAAEAALADGAHIDAVRSRNACERQWLATALAEIGISVLPSQTNFLLACFDEQTERVEAALFQRGIIVRPMGGYGLHDYLRITVSTRDDNRRLLEALKEVGA
jgi:histidinol-phosphate aminotransferase